MTSTQCCDPRVYRWEPENRRHSHPHEQENTEGQQDIGWSSRLLFPPFGFFDFVEIKETLSA